MSYSNLKNLQYFQAKIFDNFIDIQRLGTLDFLWILKAFEAEGGRMIELLKLQTHVKSIKAIANVFT